MARITPGTQTTLNRGWRLLTPACYRATLATSVQESFSTRAEALERERQIKGWTRQKKGALIRGDWDLLQTLARGGGSTGSPRTGVVRLRGCEDFARSPVLGLKLALESVSIRPCKGIYSQPPRRMDDSESATGRHAERTHPMSFALISRYPGGDAGCPGAHTRRGARS